jgi:hypothetical protein
MMDNPKMFVLPNATKFPCAVHAQDAELDMSANQTPIYR